MAKRVLLMYISEHSGHHQATIALEKAILKKNPNASVRKINTFKYTNPIVEFLTHAAYMRVIKKRPHIWGNIYDNPDFLRKTARLRTFINDMGTRKIKRLINKFKPDAVVCTQAFPCGIVSHYKKKFNSRLPLVGALTDYAPHSYWIYDNVDAYVVPNENVKDAFVAKGVPREKIKVLGTPIDLEFETLKKTDKIYKKYNLSMDCPIVLVMGGTNGIGTNKDLIKLLNDSRKEFQIIIITGINKKLFKKINKIKNAFTKKLIVLGFVDNICEIMDISSFVITKPGGLTTAEALAKALPIIIVNPLPGQEDLNAKALTTCGAALRAKDERDAVRILEDLLDNKDKIQKIKSSMSTQAKPYSSSNIVDLLNNLTN